MATITIRNVPEGLAASLKDRARRNRRSMQQEILSLLEAAALDRQAALERIRQRLRHPYDLGTGGEIQVSREELHERR